MRILYAYYASDAESHRLTIEKLRKHGYTIEVLAFQGGTPQLPASTALLPSEIEQLKNITTTNNNFDVCIWNIHQIGHKAEIFQFQKAIKCRFGYISVDHSLLKCDVESSAFKERQIAMFSFHKKNTKWLKEQGYCDSEIVKSQWYKMETNLPSIDLTPYDYNRDAAFIGAVWPAYLKNLQINQRDSYFDCFRKVWYKPAGPYGGDFQETAKKGTVMLPSPFEPTTGMYYVSQISKIWFMCAGTSYIEALLYGHIPILLDTPLLSIGEKVDSIFHQILGSKTCGGKDLKHNAIIADKNIIPIIKKLQNDEAFFESTLNKLRNEWWDEDPRNLPLYSDALLGVLSNLKK